MSIDREVAEDRRPQECEDGYFSPIVRQQRLKRRLNAIYRPRAEARM